MIRGLIEKELRQHGMLIFTLLALLMGGFFLLQSTDILVRMGGSSFALLSMLLLVLGPITALVLGNLLIAGEFRQKTQIFLEGLPLARHWMLIVKYLFGLTILMTVTLIMLAIAWFSTMGQEAMTERFAALLITKAVGWAWFCWAACFAHAFLGRYRIAFGSAIVVGLIFAQQSAGIMVNRFGPFELIGERFAYERFEWPTLAIAYTAILIVALTFAGFALGLVRDATLASMLSEKMSSREKIVVVAFMLAGMMVLGSSAERIEKTDTLHLPDAIDVQLRAATVSASAAVSEPTEDEKKLLGNHAQAAAELLASVADYLGNSQLPPLFMVHRRDLAEGELEDGDLDSRQGYLVRVNMALTPSQNHELQRRIIERVLSANQHYRLQTDRRGWIVDGFATWWPLRNEVITPADLVGLRKHTESCKASSITPENIGSWLKFSKEVDDEPLVSTIAGVGVMTLGRVDEKGRQRVLSEILGHAVPHDFRASLYDAWHPVATTIKANTNMDLDSFASAWNDALHQVEESR